jgi:subtilisin family serine protease
MATPLVTAAAVLVKNIHPALSAREVFGHLLKSARKYSYDSAGEFFFPLPAGRYGQGIVNVENALELVKAQKN